MFKKMVITFLLGMTLIISGCGSSDGEGESALETQQLLDNGEFTAVISKLEGSANSTSDYLSLAAAYMGKAGFSLSSIIGIVVSSAESGEDSTFASFIENSKETSNIGSLADLKIAVGYYEKVVSKNCTDVNATFSGAEEDLCLYIGLSKVSQTAVAIGYITDNVDVLNDKNASDPKLTASLCAIQYSLDGNTSVSPLCTFSAEQNLTFVQSTKTYASIDVTVDGNVTFEYLISGQTNPRSTVLTSGFCTLDSFATRVGEINDITYYVCPVDETNTTDETTSVSILVDALNDGVDSVGAVVSDDVQADIDQFKQEIIDTRTDGDTSSTISIEDILKYLEDNNK
ncbi:hypothetical protein MNB_SM-4-1812 [hydrothermal vent metagenome]|uniref:Lipoprotein n=1 Tax=hydrothermal vent metagenome TaxID=652676 RepID=A0A1W1CAK2_9ZZZZ